MKLSAVDDPSFSSAIVARDVLYGLLALKAKSVQPRRSFHVMKLECLRPPAEMLTSLEVNASVPVIAMPPFHDAKPFEVAIRQGNGQFSFTADNEDLYFRDSMESDGCVICYDLHLVRTPELVYSKVIRNEVGPNCVDIGQIAQVTLKFRALQQPDGGFVFRELLKSVCVLDDGISMASGF